MQKSILSFLLSSSVLLSGCHAVESVFSDRSDNTSTSAASVETYPAAPRHSFSNKAPKHHHHQSMQSAEIGSMSAPLTPEHAGGVDTTLPATPGAAATQPAATIATQPAAPAPQTTTVAPDTTKKPVNQTVVPNVAPALE